MGKKVKMVLYAEPGVGKSTFASKAYNPFFICTDGNYAWLDRPEEDHVEVFSWTQCKKIFADIASSDKYAKYDTIVIDLVEDLFKWVEYEYCQQNKLTHVSDQGYGKAYDITRNEFYIEISKLLGLDKNILLLSHGLTKIEKDRRGVENTKYIPSTRIPDKVWDMIEGRVRYFLRAYIKGEEDENGDMVKRRYLSIVPKENEYGISRGLDENTVPHDIELDWNTFASILGLDKPGTPSVKKVETPHLEVPKDQPVNVPVKEPELVIDNKINEHKVIEVNESTERTVEPIQEKPQEVSSVVVDTPKQVTEPINIVPSVEPVDSTSSPEPKREMTQAEKIAAIKAKFAARNN